MSPRIQESAEYILGRKDKICKKPFRNKALETKEVIRSILQDKDNGNSAYMFVADQTPHVSEIHYGLEFLNQKTPAFIGYDKLSTKKILLLFTVT